MTTLNHRAVMFWVASALAAYAASGSLRIVAGVTAGAIVFCFIVEIWGIE